MSRRVKLPSGRMGWQGRLRANYGSFGEFGAYAEIYNLHGRLGFETPEEAWEANPMVQGSTEPSDFALAPVHKEKA